MSNNTHGPRTRSRSNADHFTPSEAMTTKLRSSALNDATGGRPGMSRKSSSQQRVRSVTPMEHADPLAIMGRMRSPDRERDATTEDEDDDFVMVSVSPLPKGSNRTASQTSNEDVGSSLFGARQKVIPRRPLKNQRSLSHFRKSSGEQDAKRAGSPSLGANACGMTQAAERLSLMETDAMDDPLALRPRLATHQSDPFAANSPVRHVPGQSRSLGKALLSRTRSGVEDDAGSSPDSVRRQGGSWIKRSKATTFGTAFNSPQKRPEQGETSISSMDSIYADMHASRGSPGGSHRRHTSEEDDSLMMSSSPPAPDTPIHNRSASMTSNARPGPLRPGVPQPRFPPPSTIKTHAWRVASMDADYHASPFLSPKPSIPVSIKRPLPAGTVMQDGEKEEVTYTMSLNSPDMAPAYRRPSLPHADSLFGGTGLSATKKTASMGELQQLGYGKENHIKRPSLGNSPARIGSLYGVASNRRGKSASGSSLTEQSYLPRATLPRSQAVSLSGWGNKPHRRTTSGDSFTPAVSSGLVPSSNVMSRSHGLKSGLSDTVKSGSDSAKLAKSKSTSSRTLVGSVNANSDLPTGVGHEVRAFEEVKPLQTAFESQEGQLVSRKFKPRDSGIGLRQDTFTGPPLPVGAKTNISNIFAPPLGKLVRPGLLKRASSCGDERSSSSQPPEMTPLEGPNQGSMWPAAFGFDPARASLNSMTEERQPSMPDTPVKKGSFGAEVAQKAAKVGQSISHPVLPTASLFSVMRPSVLKPKSRPSLVPSQPTFTATDPAGLTSSIPAVAVSPAWKSAVSNTSSPISPSDMYGTQGSSPTMRVSLKGAGTVGTVERAVSVIATSAGSVRMGLLRRLSTSAASSSEMSEDEGTPTKASGSETAMLAISGMSVPCQRFRVNILTRSLFRASPCHSWKSNNADSSLKSSGFPTCTRQSINAAADVWYAEALSLATRPFSIGSSSFAAPIYAQQSDQEESAPSICTR